MDIFTTLISGAISTSLGLLFWIVKTLSSLKTDVEVIKSKIIKINEIESQIKTMNELIIRVDERQNKCNKDINAVAGKVRDILQGGIL